LFLKARQDAYRDVIRASKGDYSENPELKKLPKRTTPKVDLGQVFEEYAAKGGLKGGIHGPTAKRWRPKIAAFVKWLALVRKAAATIGARSFQGPENTQQRLQAAARLPRQIPSELCRDVIHAMTAGCPEDAFFVRFGVEFEYAAEALARLDAIHRPLSELDDQALFDIANSAVIA
jgi:hypothetical protein